MPDAAVHDLIVQRGDQLAGRIVVDTTNPLNFDQGSKWPSHDSVRAVP